MKITEMLLESIEKKLGIHGKVFRTCLAVIKRSDLGTRASSLAFTTVLSIAPLIAVLFYVFKILGGFEYAFQHLEPFILDNLSEGTGEVVAQYLETFIQRVHATAVGWAGIAGLFFTAVMTYLSVDKAFQVIWQSDTSLKLVIRLFRAFILIVFGPVLAVISIALTTAISAQVKIVPYSGHFLAMFLNLVLFSMLYSLIPPERVKFRTAIIGSLVPAVIWEFAKSGYAIYTKKVINYSAFYGSLAAIPIFLFWVYIAWYIVLFGAVWIRSIHNPNVK